MSSYPVHFDVEQSPRFTRVQLLVRHVALLVLGMLGVSLGTAFTIAYLLLPIYAASRIASLGSAAEYGRRDGRGVLRALSWFAAVSAWSGLVVEALPARDPGETVHVDIDETPLRSSPVAALLRLLTGLGSALVLCLLGMIGFFVWLWAALSIVLREDVGPVPLSYLVGLQRWGMRLLAHQACLVDQYPPFSFSDGARQASAGDHTVTA